MPPLTSRRTGRTLAGIAGALVLGLAVRTAQVESMPDLHVYDGWWMVGGGVLTLLVLAPLAWRWPRERALLLVTVGTALGAWLPLVVLALKGHIPIAARLKGAIFFSSADVIGVTLPVGLALGWLALQEHRPAGPPTESTHA